MNKTPPREDKVTHLRLLDLVSSGGGNALDLWERAAAKGGIWPGGGAFDGALATSLGATGLAASTASERPPRPPTEAAGLFLAGTETCFGGPPALVIMPTTWDIGPKLFAASTALTA